MKVKTKKINRNAISKEFFKLNPIKKKNWKSKNKYVLVFI